MLYLKTILLGIIQGLTEFLPISSTGHLIIAEKFLPLENVNLMVEGCVEDPFPKAFFTIVQLGSVLAVILHFRKKLLPAELFSSSQKWKELTPFWGKILLGVIPVLFIGGLFGGAIQDRLYGILPVAISLFFGGIVMIVIERCHKKTFISDMGQLTFSRAIGIGLCQCLALIPGVSRSASSIIGGLLLGANRETAVEYSFYLSIPTIVAASAYSILKNGLHFTGPQQLATFFGFLAAFFSSWAVIGLFMKYIRKYDFQPFGYYRMALGLVLYLFLR